MCNCSDLNPCLDRLTTKGKPQTVTVILVCQLSKFENARQNKSLSRKFPSRIEHSGTNITLIGMWRIHYRCHELHGPILMFKTAIIHILPSFVWLTTTSRETATKPWEYFAGKRTFKTVTDIKRLQTTVWGVYNKFRLSHCHKIEKRFGWKAMLSEFSTLTYRRRNQYGYDLL